MNIPKRLVFAAQSAMLGLASACAVTRSEHIAAQGALGPYSAVVVSGDLVFVSGRVGKVDGSPFEAEAESAIGSLAVELKRVGLDLRDVVNVTVYLTDMELYPKLNEVYAKAFPAPYPARTCVAVSALPARARVEIAAQAKRR